ncbi:energy transducer TonB family protein [Novosphingobium beihaiensis]|uniref:Energy transducer TonB n=1 Tax=Novosphingobium beihaiensis TaxID=2930389 RepID=A0ABT0BPA5_9SPHN|nr:energy transducer TonB [Novosphingobium beihaiensis]MCJ2186693.1 energy transducer TonB [Novosphingobium beihaiensis]
MFQFAARPCSRRREGVVRVRFRTNRAGRMVEAAIVEGAGYASLDREALAALRRAQPLPGIPGNGPEPLDVTVPIEFLLARKAGAFADARSALAPTGISGRN